MDFRTFASFTPCWTTKWDIKTITRTAEQTQVLVLWLKQNKRKNKQKHIFTLSCGLAAGNGAAHEAEIYIDLFAFPGKTSGPRPRYMIQTSLLLAMVALKAAFVDKSGLRGIRNNCTATGSGSTGVITLNLMNSNFISAVTKDLKSDGAACF